MLLFTLLYRRPKPALHEKNDLASIFAMFAKQFLKRSFYPITTGFHFPFYVLEYNDV